MWWCTKIDKYGVHNMLCALLMFSLTRYFGVAVLEGRLLVAGGFAGKEGGFLTSVEEMEIVEDASSWVESSFNLNTPRSVVDFPLLHSIQTVKQTTVILNLPQSKDTMTSTSNWNARMIFGTILQTQQSNMTNVS